MAFFNNQSGAQTFRGRDGTYDQVDYGGSLTDYTFAQSADGTVTVTDQAGVTDTLLSIDGIWFGGERAWYDMGDILSASLGVGGYVDAFGIITGSEIDNVLVGGNGQDLFYGGMGDDVIDGGGGDYNQAEMDGELIEYTLVRNADGSVTMSHPTWGTDTLIDIDGFWFMREQAWYSVDDAVALTANLPRFRLDADNVLNGTPGRDVMRADADGTNFYGGTGNDTYRGRADAYDQVNYDGAPTDYNISVGANGVTTVSHPVWGRDRLVDIDGVYFNGNDGEGAGWFAAADLVAASGAAPLPREFRGLDDDAPFLSANPDWAETSDRYDIDWGDGVAWFEFDMMPMSAEMDGGLFF